MNLFLLLILSTGHSVYHVHGISSPPALSHPSVNLEVTLYSRNSDWFMEIRVRPESLTKVTRRVQDLFSSMKRGEGDTCVELSGRLCSILKREKIPCREVHGLLYSTKLPAKLSGHFVPDVHGIPHRWIQFFDLDQGWVALDPVHPAGRVSPRHVPVAVEALWPDVRIEEMVWD